MVFQCIEQMFDVQENAHDGRTRAMRFRLGIVVGFGAGYYFGARAGRERFEDINRMIRKIKRTDAFDTATDKAKAVVDLGVERAKDVIEDKIGHNGDTSAATTAWPATADPIVTP
jgi:hypothetical protein